MLDLILVCVSAMGLADPSAALWCPIDDARLDRSSRANFETSCARQGGQVVPYSNDGRVQCVCRGGGSGQPAQQWDAGAFVTNLGRLFTDPFGARARAGSGAARTPTVDRATVLNDQGLAAWNARDYTTARDRFAAALRHAPSDAVIRRNLASAWRQIAWQHHQLLDYPMALAALRQAVTIDPTLTDLRAQLDRLEREYDAHNQKARLRAAQRLTDEQNRARLAALAAQMTEGLSAAGTTAASDLPFMDATSLAAAQSDPASDPSVVDLRDAGDRPVIDPSVFSRNPAVQREQAALEADEAAWRARAEEGVRRAAMDPGWTEMMLRLVREGESATDRRYLIWAIQPEADPALDSTLIATVREAYPHLTDSEDLRLLRGIARARITSFLGGVPDPASTARESGGSLAAMLERMVDRDFANRPRPVEELVEDAQFHARDMVRAVGAITGHAWTNDILKALERPPAERDPADAALLRTVTDRIAAEQAAGEAPPAFVPLSGLKPGDVVLVAPASEQIDGGGAVSARAIQAADYLTRVASDFANGGLAAAASTEAHPASHALAFVGVVDGRMLFLNHNPGRPSQIVDYREMLVEYGAREMFVARPQPPVDGRALWAAAQEQTGYGLVGDKVLCSERVGVALARAGVPLNSDRIGPVDITPGDFFDRENNVGKHFVVTRLRISGVPPRPAER